MSSLRLKNFTGIRTIRAVALMLIAVSLIGCTFKSVRHDHNVAVEAGNAFLSALYLQRNYSRALELADESFRKTVSLENLGQMVDMAEKNCGTRKEFKAESYQMAPNVMTEVYYVETCDRGVVYHRLVLVGDATNGYSVAGVWLNSSPYPQNSLRQKFEKDIVVK
jgi:hypothetical protein